MLVLAKWFGVKFWVEFKSADFGLQALHEVN
jgi:hypothetical protein